MADHHAKRPIWQDEVNPSVRSRIKIAYLLGRIDAALKVPVPKEQLQ